ncbi:MAG: rod shape-determining protein [Candidatus Liptonbacteria bacterium RIFCSPLOWO2_01_FULL_45_15]|uniref:Cell shape-determining protein MreB n=1 Tax=Candidatus Liptonbacteria bacterium RIFCSPLOWO2_01_FULL_45_15 TaxID=1798649 RepID=A0A1G2CEX2_9BACT|nr:MAG: rod shape-determining protein [Candidatus Liptonbacteria bacterium RIFCSPLOWO2_01_FULL_45_15]
MSIFDNLFKEIGIDLGTANSLVYQKNRGLVLNEPTVAAVNNKTMEILAVGEKAKKMLGRTPEHISVIRPLVNGVISDFDMTQELLRQFIKRLSGENSLWGVRRAVLSVPDDLTEVERKSVEDAAEQAGCAKVHLMSAPMAVAIGAGLPVDEPTASLIVDIGGGTTDIAVISLGGTVICKTLKIGGDRFNEDIMKFVRDEFHLAIGEPTSEFAKIAVGSAIPLDEKLDIAIRGMDLSTGLPKEVLIKNSQVRVAIAKSLRSIVDSIKEIIESAPPELVGDMLKQGIYISGGGALLRGIDRLIERETFVETKIVDDPLTASVRGLGFVIENFDHHKRFLSNPLRPLEISL